MDQQAYLRRLRARIEHVEGALRRELDAELDHPARRHVEALQGHASRIEAAGETWEEHRAAVEKTWEELHAEVERHGTVLGEVAESVRDGAVELFRGEPSRIIQEAEEIIRKWRKGDG